MTMKPQIKRECINWVCGVQDMKKNKTGSLTNIMYKGQLGYIKSLSVLQNTDEKIREHLNK